MTRGNSEASPPEDFQTSHQSSSSCFGTPRTSCYRPRDARIRSACSLPLECRVRLWAFRNDHCNRLQERFKTQRVLCQNRKQACKKQARRPKHKKNKPNVHERKLVNKTGISSRTKIRISSNSLTSQTHSAASRVARNKNAKHKNHAQRKTRSQKCTRPQHAVS